VCCRACTAGPRGEDLGCHSHPGSVGHQGHSPLWLLAWPVREPGGLGVLSPTLLLKAGWCQCLPALLMSLAALGQMCWEGVLARVPCITSPCSRPARSREPWSTSCPLPMRQPGSDLLTLAGAGAWVPPAALPGWRHSPRHS